MILTAAITLSIVAYGLWMLWVVHDTNGGRGMTALSIVSGDTSPS